MGAINYPELFYLLGRDVYWTNVLLNEQNTLYLAPTFGMSDDIQNAYSVRRGLIPNATTTIVGFAFAMAAQITAAPLLYASNTLMDLQADLNSPANNTQTILPLLYADMIANSETIMHNVIAAPAVNPAGTNTGNGVLVANNLNVLGITDERIISQGVRFRCTQSVYSGGQLNGEVFQVSGVPALPSPTFYGTQGTGGSTTLRVADSQNTPTNGNFETWAGSPLTPSGWTIVAGTPAVNIIQNTANPHNGTSCLEFAGDGTTPTIEINQVIAPQVSSNTVYALGVWLRRAGTVNAGSTLTISIQGTGAVTQVAASLDPSLLTTSYALHYLFFTTAGTVGNGIPADYAATIEWSSANLAGDSAQILIDDIVFVRPITYGYTQYVLFGGDEPFVVGDSFAVTTTRLSSGVFQEFFCRFYQTFLPSSASPSISDSLAENTS